MEKFLVIFFIFLMTTTISCAPRIKFVVNAPPSPPTPLCTSGKLSIAYIGTQQSFVPPIQDCPSLATSIYIKMWGSGGGSGGGTDNTLGPGPGGGGGYVASAVTFDSSHTYSVFIGQGGLPFVTSGFNSGGGQSDGGNGGPSNPYASGGGGGRSSFSIDGIEVLTAGAGGGGGVSGYYSYLWTGGAGGGGYYGGGTGCSPSSGQVSGGGGGSSYISNTSLISSSITLSGSGSNPGNSTDIDIAGAGVGGVSYAAGTNGIVSVYYGVGAIASIIPATGSISGGATVNIYGLGFTAGTYVTIGGASCTNVSILSENQLTCITPPQTSLGIVDVTLKTPNAVQSTLIQGFNYNS